MRRYRGWALALCLAPAVLLAQRGFWGVGYISNPLPEHPPHGFIFRTDAQGDSLVLVHEFNLADGSGAGPARLVAAANGRLYGSSVLGGMHGDGLLFEFDPDTDSLRTVHHFQDGAPGLLFAKPDHGVGLTEVAPGVLYGQVKPTYIVPAPPGRIFAFHTQTEAVSLVTAVPGFVGGPWNDAQNNYIKNGFFKAANGFVYTAGARNSTCPGGQPDNGSIFRINPGTGAIATVYINPCNTSEGRLYNTPQIEQDGLLFGTAAGGDGVVFPGNMNGFGVLYSFDPQAQAYAKLHAFQGAPLDGEDPHPALFAAADGKWYGTTERGGMHDRGTIYAYDPATGEASVRYHFQNTTHPAEVSFPGRLQLAVSNGKLYGTTRTGIFEFDPATDAVRKTVDVTRFESGPLLEFCRKPAYRPAPATAFSLCAGTPFSFDTGGAYHDSLVWRHNGAPAPGQSATVLQFAAVAEADAGVWQLELVNACGSTFAPPLTLAVQPADAQTVTSVILPGTHHAICPGDSIQLTGNAGGTWNTGQTAPAIWAHLPGSYQVTNANDCGTTYSNVIVVDTFHRPAPVIHSTPQLYCPGDSLVIHGNMEGMWSNGQWGSQITVPAEPNVQYALFAPWECGTEVSNWFWLQPWLMAHDEPLPVIIPQGSPVLCADSTLVLHSNNPQIPNSTYWWRWRKIEPDGNLDFLGDAPTWTVTEPGDYVLEQRTPCGVYRYSDTLHVAARPPPPPAPGIISSMGTFHICPGDTVVLATNAGDPLWSTGDAAAAITVHAAGTYLVADRNACGTTWSEAVEVIVSTDAGTLPVSWTPDPAPLCETDGPVALAGGWPQGGTFAGPGVQGGAFLPDAAGAGTHLLTYTCVNAFGCTGTAQAAITVNALPLAPVTMVMMVGQESTITEFCANEQNFAFPIPVLPGEWDDGDTTGVRTLTASGTYRCRYVNSCGPGPWSEPLTVTVHPVADTLHAVTVCPGDSVTVGPHVHHLPGTYTDTLATAFGCDSVVVTVLDHHNLTLDAGVHVGDDALTATGAGATYQWLDCDQGMAPVPGATGQTFVPPASGHYAVVLTSTVCAAVSDTSACVAYAGPVHIVGAAADQGIGVHPNPTTGPVRITSEAPIMRVEVRDLHGRLVATHRPMAHRVALDLGAQPTGVYFLHLAQPDAMHVVKVLVGR